MNSNWIYNPETFNSGRNYRYFVPRDLEFWWMTLENNRTSLLYYIKQTDGRTDRQTERSVLRAAWSQPIIWYLIWGPTVFLLWQFQLLVANPHPINFNLLAPGRCCNNFHNEISEHMLRLRIKFVSTSCEIARYYGITMSGREDYYWNSHRATALTFFQINH